MTNKIDAGAHFGVLLAECVAAVAAELQRDLGDGFEGYVEPVAVAAVDGTGAGDAFNAGVLYGKLAGWPFERCVQLGNAAGAQATTAVGAAEAATDLRELAPSGAYA